MGGKVRSPMFRSQDLSWLARKTPAPLSPLIQIKFVSSAIKSGGYKVNKRRFVGRSGKD